jgi:endonuclease-3
VITIISQNTADRNTARAFQTLSSRFEISPESLSKAELSKIEAAIKVAGLYKSKAKAIQKASKIILENFSGKIQTILELPLDEARRVFMQFPGVGPKTADVVLLFSASQPTVPVDTHVNRVAKRLGLVPFDGDYEVVRNGLQTLYDPADYLAVHLLFIAHGRRFCKAPRPLCKQCPVNMFCPSNGLWD